MPWTPESIKALRTQLHLSQEEFAHQLGVTRITVSRWEKGEAHPVFRHQRVLDKLVKKGKE